MANLTPRILKLYKLSALLVPIGILGYGIFIPAPSSVDQDIQIVLSIFIATVLLWATKLIPYTISSILCLLLLYMTGLTETFTEAATGFSSTLVFFFILLLLIGKSLAKVGLDDWIAARLVHETSTPSGTIRRLIAAVLLLAFVIPSGLARAVTFIPIINQTNELYQGKPDSHFRRLSYYLIGHLNSVGSMALMTGGGMAIVTAEIINEMVHPFTWVEWALYMIPPVIFLFLVSALTASQFYDIEDAVQLHDVNNQDLNEVTNSIEPERDSLTKEHKFVITILLSTIVFWVVGSFVGIPAIIPALFMVIVFSLPWIQIITAEDVRSLNWGIIFLIGAMLSLAEVMQATQATQIIVNSFLEFSIVADGGPITIFVLLSFAIIVRCAFSGTAPVVVILLPIFLNFTEPFGIDPLFLALSLVIVLASTVILPFNYPPALLAYEKGPLSLTEVFTLGIMTTMFGFLTVVFSLIFYWPFLEIVI